MTLFRVVPLAVAAQPTYDAITQTCYRDGIENVGGWRQKWTIAALPVDIAAANQAAHNLAVSDSTDIGTAKGNPVIQYLVTHTPAQCVTKINTDVTDLASAKVMLGNFAQALCVLARDKLR